MNGIRGDAHSEIEGTPDFHSRQTEQENPRIRAEFEQPTLGAS